MVWGETSLLLSGGWIVGNMRQTILKNLIF